MAIHQSHAGWTWGLSLDAFGYAGAGTPIQYREPVRTGRGRVVYDRGEGLEEWFESLGRGLEHGFTVHTRPRGGSGKLVFHLAVRGELRPHGGGSALVFVNGRGAPVLDYSGLRAWDATGRDLPARMDPSPGGGIALTVEERGARYPIYVDPIVQEAYVKAFNSGPEDWFGRAVAISGDTAVVGALREDSAGAGVNNGQQDDNSLAESGAAYVFVRTAGVWTQQAYLKPSNPGAGDFFGLSVAISGDTIVVGAPREDSAGTGVNGPGQQDNSGIDSGAAYVFTRSGGVWSQQAYLKASNTGVGDDFGWSVAVSGDTVVVGAPSEDSAGTGAGGGQQADDSASVSGAVYVFVRSGGAWSQQAYIKASNTGAGDGFGDSVAVAGDTIAAGAHGEDSSGAGVNGSAQGDNGAPDSGAVYVFARSGIVWSQQAYVKASNTKAGDYFSHGAVSISGDTMAVGARSEDTGAADSGAAYVFVRSAGSWTQQAFIKAPAASGGDFFGQSVSVSGATLVVGAFLRASGTGSAYVFARSGSAWPFQAPLGASNANVDDWFGLSVGLSGDTAIVGAIGESSSGRGVNSAAQADNSSPNSGAAYLFRLTGIGLDVTSPAENQTIGVSSVTLGWTRDDDAAGYSVRVTRQASGEVVFSGELSGSASTSAVVPLPAGGLTASIRSCTGAALSNCPGVYPPRNFTVQLAAPAIAPSIQSPANGATLTTSTQNLTWTAVTGATRYEVTLRNNTIGTADLAITVFAPSLGTIFSMRGGQYRLEVRACTEACGPAGAAEFSVQLPAAPPAAPTLTCSVASSNGQNNLGCSWTAVAGADLYVARAIQTSAGPGGGALTVASRQVSATDASFLIPNGAAKVLVQACNGDGCGPQSAPFDISPAFGNPTVPILGEPVAGFAVNGPTVLFTWNRIPGDNGSGTPYRLYVQDLSRQQPALDVLTTQNFWAAQFAPGFRFDALVIANPNGTSAAGPPAGFTTRGANPGSPAMVKPQHQGRTPQGNVTLGWTPLPGSQLYQYFVARQGQGFASATGVTVGLEVRTPLPAVNGQDTGYVGIVRACANGTNCSASSDAGWGPWSNDAGGAGVTSFTVAP